VIADEHFGSARWTPYCNGSVNPLAYSRTAVGVQPLGCTGARQSVNSNLNALQANGFTETLRPAACGSPRLLTTRKLCHEIA